MTSKFDFEAAKSKVKAKAAEVILPAVQPAPPIEATELSRVQHIISEHLTELTSWEEDFIYSQLIWLKKVEGNRLSAKVLNHIKLMEERYCHSKCPILNRS